MMTAHHRVTVVETLLNPVKTVMVAFPLEVKV